MTFTATNARFLMTFKYDGTHLWSAEIKASRDGGTTRDFTNILFMETDTTASIFGIEVNDEVRDIRPVELGEPQQAFIQFLRQESARDSILLGPLQNLFSGREYSCELKATTAYLALRKTSLQAGVGFYDAQGIYNRLAIVLED